MKQSIFLLGLFLCLTTPSCVPYYIAGNFDVQTANHKTVAVLPFEMVYTGIMPEGLRQEDLEEIGIGESKAFQMSFYHEILRSTRSGRKPIRVNLQDYRKTLQILEENKIGIQQSWSENPEYLAAVLGVDAVVRGRIEKNRLMPDLASFGIEMGIHILNAISDFAVWPWLPPFGAVKSKQVLASYSLMERQNGEVLWSVSFQEDADWRQRVNEIIDTINRKGARRFPYRD